MYYLVGFPRSDKKLLVILHSSKIYNDCLKEMPKYKIGDTYYNLAILSDLPTK